jgi:hypothetical protein
VLEHGSDVGAAASSLGGRLEPSELRFNDRADHVHDHGAEQPSEARRELKGPLPSGIHLICFFGDPEQKVFTRPEDSDEKLVRGFSDNKCLGEKVGDKAHSTVIDFVRPSVTASSGVSGG